jgi:hypothetical protein
VRIMRGAQPSVNAQARVSETRVSKCGEGRRPAHSAVMDDDRER